MGSEIAFPLFQVPLLLLSKWTVYFHATKLVIGQYYLAYKRLPKSCGIAYRFCIHMLNMFKENTYCIYCITQHQC